MELMTLQRSNPQVGLQKRKTRRLARQPSRDVDFHENMVHFILNVMAADEEVRLKT